MKNKSNIKWLKDHGVWYLWHGKNIVGTMHFYPGRPYDDHMGNFPADWPIPRFSFYVSIAKKNGRDEHMWNETRNMLPLPDTYDDAVVIKYLKEKGLALYLENLRKCKQHL